MGFSVSWIAVKQKAPDAALGTLHLARSGKFSDYPDFPASGRSLANGWFLIVLDHCWPKRPMLNHYRLEEATLRALSTNCEVVACMVEEHAMFSSSECWRNGLQIWRVDHDSLSSIFDLRTTGAPPPNYAALAQQYADKQRRETANVDHHFDIPVELARSIVGFRHDKVSDTPKSFEELVIRSKKGLIPADAERPDHLAIGETVDAKISALVRARRNPTFRAVEVATEKPATVKEGEVIAGIVTDITDQGTLPSTAGASAVFRPPGHPVAFEVVSVGSSAVPKKYYDASWPFNGEFPKGLPIEAAATHIGMFFVWSMVSGLDNGGEDTELERKIRQREITPGAYFLRAHGGKLIDYDLSETGNTFATAYLHRDGPFIRDYVDTVGDDLPSVYHVADTWETFDRLKPVFDRRFAEWQSRTSERRVDWVANAIVRQELRSSLKVGQVLDGVVRRIGPHVATIDMGGVDGFLLLSDIDCVPALATLGEGLAKLGVGDTVTVEISDINTAWVSVRFKQLKQRGGDPRERIERKFPVGGRFKGRVSDIMEYGVSVTLEPGVVGLLHISDIAWRRLNHPSEVLTLGQSVEVQVLKVNPETQRISLGMKHLEGDPWVGIELKYPVGSRVKGRVTHIADYGFLVELEPGVVGLGYTWEMSWTEENVHPSKIVSTGQEVEVMVLDIDPPKRRIGLGLKQCLPSPRSCSPPGAAS